LEAKKLLAQAEEVFRVGVWSVRKLAGPDSRLFFVHVEEHRVEVQPPQEVLSALHLHSDGTDDNNFADGEEGAGEGSVGASSAAGSAAGSRPGSVGEGSGGAGSAAGSAAGSRPASAASRRGTPSRSPTPSESPREDSGSASPKGPERPARPRSGRPRSSASLDGGSAECPTEPESPARPDSGRPRSSSSRRAASPRFQRIILGAKCEMPLKMARDILEALQEDVSIFAEVQEHFSDAPHEPELSLGEGGGLGEELEELAVKLQPGEISDVVATEVGMQILLRVS